MKTFKWMAMGMLVASLAVFSCKDEDENAHTTGHFCKLHDFGVQRF